MEISQGSAPYQTESKKESHHESQSIKHGNVAQPGAVEYQQPDLKRRLAQRHLVREPPPLFPCRAPYRCVVDPHTHV